MDIFILFCILIFVTAVVLLLIVLLTPTDDEKFQLDVDSHTWCYCKGDFVRSKECGGECETCKHFVTVDDLK